MVLVGVALMAGGCGRHEDEQKAATFNVEAVTDVPPARPAPPDKAALLPPFDPPVPGAPGGLPNDDRQIIAAPFPVDSLAAAADTVQRYYAALEKGDVRNAYALWGDHGRAYGKDEAGFARDLADYSEYHANIGHPGRIDAGAGQRYVTIPVQPYVRDRATKQPRYFIGTVTLHSTAVDGATAEQRRWHIQAIDLKPVIR